MVRARTKLKARFCWSPVSHHKCLYRMNEEAYQKKRDDFRPVKESNIGTWQKNASWLNEWQVRHRPLMVIPP